MGGSCNENIVDQKEASGIVPVLLVGKIWCNFTDRVKHDQIVDQRLQMPESAREGELLSETSESLWTGHHQIDTI